MKLVKFLSVFVCSMALVAGAFAQEKKSCCETAKAAGKECAHKCCVAAKKDGKVCEKCNGKKEEKK